MPRHFLELAEQFHQRADQMRHIADGAPTRDDGDELTRLASQYDNLAWKYEDQAFALMAARAQCEAQERGSDEATLPCFSRFGDRSYRKQHHDREMTPLAPHRWAGMHARFASLRLRLLSGRARHG